MDLLAFRSNAILCGYLDLFANRNRIGHLCSFFLDDDFSHLYYLKKKLLLLFINCIIVFLVIVAIINRSYVIFVLNLYFSNWNVLYFFSCVSFNNNDVAVLCGNKSRCRNIIFRKQGSDVQKKAS